MYKEVSCHCSTITAHVIARSSMMWPIWLCFVSSVVLIVAHDGDIHTIQYTSDTFSIEVPKNNHFVMFFAPWLVCTGLLRNKQPQWGK